MLTSNTVKKNLSYFGKARVELTSSNRAGVYFGGTKDRLLLLAESRLEGGTTFTIRPVL